MWPTIANNGRASSSPILATEEPSESLVTVAKEAALRQTSLAGPSYPEGPGAPSRSRSSSGASPTARSMHTVAGGGDTVAARGGKRCDIASLDDDAARPVGEHVAGRTPQKPLVVGSVLGADVDEVGVALDRLVDDRPPGVAGSKEPDADFEMPRPRLQTGNLQDVATKLVLLLQALVESKLVGHSQHVEGLHLRVRPDELRRAGHGVRVDVRAEYGHESGAVRDLVDAERALGPLDPVLATWVESLAPPVEQIAGHADDHPPGPDHARLRVKYDH